MILEKRVVTSCISYLRFQKRQFRFADKFVFSEDSKARNRLVCINKWSTPKIYFTKCETCKYINRLVCARRKSSDASY